MFKKAKLQMLILLVIPLITGYTGYYLTVSLGSCQRAR